MRRGLVYFIQQDVTLAVKIGYTETMTSLAVRLADLQTGSPYPLRVIYQTDGSQEFERRLHRRFREQRLRGEWFAPTMEMAEMILALKKGERLTPHRLRAMPFNCESESQLGNPRPWESGT